MTDDDAAASTGATASIEEETQGGENAPSVSQKKPLDNGGWFTATYQNSRLIAVPETGAEVVDKSASGQPKQKGNPLRKVKLPPLPKTDFKVIIRPRDGLNISQLSTHQMARAITKACGNPDICNESNLLIRLRNRSNIVIMSKQSMETANIVQSLRSLLRSLRLGAKDYAVMAYVSAPDNSCTGAIHGLDAGTTPTELLAHLRPGHRADECPTPGVVVCSNCTETVIEDGQTCEQWCALCKEAHPTRAKECKERLRRPRSPRPRTKEQTAAEAQGADGRSRARKRWFSRDVSSPSRSRSASKSRSWLRSASRTHQAPETRKKQQKKPVTRKEEDGTVSRKAPFFSASPTAPKNTNTQTVLVGKNVSAPPNNEVKELRQAIQALWADNAELRQKLNDLIDELKALRTGQTDANPQTDLTLTATVGCQEFTTTMAAMKNSLANLSNLISNIQVEARKDRDCLVQLMAMKSKGIPFPASGKLTSAPLCSRQNNQQAKRVLSSLETLLRGTRAGDISRKLRKAEIWPEKLITEG
ncbi:hypothetical protein HPB51_028470 [Rhipicephalus microplus]|uniref:Uncharacterized protein n=1 Tax=Rhipicephalus microplus TaxID=6941 RepID=A0A9J6CX78_RHIMP|nr:hypothetical protein HPB51_028470 [Rhipicephalus microplus]